MGLIELEILYCVWTLGTNALHLPIMLAVQAATGYKFHKQNFRRMVEQFVTEGYLSEHECYVRPKGKSGGRPCRVRFEVTETGIQALREYERNAEDLIGRIKEIP